MKMTVHLSSKINSPATRSSLPHLRKHSSRPFAAGLEGVSPTPDPTPWARPAAPCAGPGGGRAGVVGGREWQRAWAVALHHPFIIC